MSFMSKPESVALGSFELSIAGIIVLMAAGFILTIGLPSLIVAWLMIIIATSDDGIFAYSRFFWTVLSSVCIWILLFGFPFVDAKGILFSGILIRNFSESILALGSKIVSLKNLMLPNKWGTEVVTEGWVRLYFWSTLFVAIIAVAYGLFSGIALKRRNNPVGQFIVRLASMPTAWLLSAEKSKNKRKQQLKRNIFFSVGIVGSLILVFLVPKYAGIFMASFLLSSLLGLSVLHSIYIGPIVIKKKENAEKLLIGHYIKKKIGAIFVTRKQMQHHIHILGASGFGKSVLLMRFIRYRIQNGHGLFYIDLKADFETLQEVVFECKKANRLHDLKVLSCAHPELSMPYNIVARGNANEICDRLMSSFTWSETFYRDQCAGLLLKALRGLVLARDLRKIDFHLGDILQMVTNPDFVLKIKKLIPEKGLYNTEHQLLADIDAYLRNPDRSKNIQSLRTQMEQILLSDYGKLIEMHSPDGIDIFRAARERQIVVIFLDSRRYSVAAPALGKMIIQDLKAASSQVDSEVAKKDIVPFGVVIDEFADLAQPSFIEFQDRARSSGMGIIVAHQELADLKKISPEFPVRLSHLCGSTFAFLTKGSEASEAIASTAGTQLTVKATERVSAPILGIDLRSGEKSIREVEEFNVHPNDIKNLKVGECILIQKYPKPNAAVIRVCAPHPVPFTRSETIEILQELNSSSRVRRPMVQNMDLAQHQPNSAHLDGSAF